MNRFARVALWPTLTIMILGLSPTRAQSINPYGRTVISRRTLLRWDFTRNDEHWQALHHSKLSVKDGLLQITSEGPDPYLHGPELNPGVAGPVSVKMRLKCATVGEGQIFWRTQPSPGWSEDKSARFNLTHDSQWHEYLVNLPAQGDILQIRFDPGHRPGNAEIDYIEITRKNYHPLEIEKLSCTPAQIQLSVKNHIDKNIDFTINDKPFTIAPHAQLPVTLDTPGQSAFTTENVVLDAPGIGRTSRTVFICRPDGQADWVERKSDKLLLRVSKDGAGAQLKINNRVAALLAPLVHYDGVVPQLKLVEKDNEIIAFQGNGIAIELLLRGDELQVKIDSEKPCAGPVLRALGLLEQAIFPGLEYLGKGESSSSKLDIETEEHLRFAPDTWKVTMPLMACVTEHAAIALTWQNMNLQPVFAVPNFFDGTNDHRLALRGKKINASIRLSKSSLEDCIVWALNKRALPNLPTRPRTWNEQRQLCLAAFNGPLKGPDGWGHCAEANWPRHPYADHASTIFRLTGSAPQLDKIVLGGAHIPNDTIYFVTGKAQQWLNHKSNQIKSLISQQQPDGSFRYQGKYQRGHFEDTASGFCAQKAKQLLEYAWITGDDQALKAGLKTLEYMKRFRTPRGAQTWELSLHTPDILASAYLVWAYVRGYELTGSGEYLNLARKWAITGVPFVYQWSRRPVMAYATVAVYGATNWRQPNWMGLPVQWCGTVYAYALLLLEPHDHTLNWRQLAEGILITAEQMQYEKGDTIGTLPDAFELKAQQRRPANINPCALVSLQLRLDGKIDSFSVAADKKHRVAAPFNVTINNNKAYIDAQKGITYQVLINGQKIIDVTSQGQDVINLE